MSLQSMSRDEIVAFLDDEFATVNQPIEGSESEFYWQAWSIYQELIARLGLLGSWILPVQNGDRHRIDDLQIGLPDGSLHPIPDVYDMDTEALDMGKAADFFLALPRFAVIQVGAPTS